MKHKICKGKIYVIPMLIYGVLKHFVEDFQTSIYRKDRNEQKMLFFFSLRSPCTIFK